MAADASSLHCPNCGAPAEPDARRCRYCEARLATVSCPSCFALIFDGAAFCPRCGARRARAERDGEAARCPGCRKPMQPLQVGSTAMLECDGCDGIWVDADVFESLCADQGSAGRGHSPVRTERGPRRARSIPAVPALRQDDEPRQLRPALGNHRRRLQGCTARSWIPASSTGSWNSSDRAASSAPARVSSRSSRTRSGGPATRRRAPRASAVGADRSVDNWNSWTFMIGDDS